MKLCKYYTKLGKNIAIYAYICDYSKKVGNPARIAYCPLDVTPCRDENLCSSIPSRQET